MNVFITGATDLLASSLIRSAPKNVELSASYNVNTLVPNMNCIYYKVDITQERQILEAFKKSKPDVVIHTAALSSPDYCDKNRKQAQYINVEGTANMLKACRQYNSSFIFISSNGIFDGKNSPYAESAIPKPIDTYGKTKYQGEMLTIASGIPFIIVRLMTMYGWGNPHERRNPATWLLEVLGKDKMSVHMVTDLYNNFLFAESGALAIWKAIILKKYGETFHIAGKDCMSRYDFSMEIADIFDFDKDMLYKATSDFFKDHVVRPKNTCFTTKKMEKFLGIKPMGVREGLFQMKKKKLNPSDWKKL